MTALTNDPTLHAAARLRWTVADAWTLTERGLRHWVRQPITVIGGMAFMVILVALYAFLFGGAMRVPGGGSYLEYLMPGMFVMTMAFGIGETMSAMSADAERGVTDRFRSMPISSAAVVLGRSVTDMIYASLGLAVMVVAGYLLGWRFHGTGAEFAAAIGLLLLLRFALLWVGIVLGLLIPGPSAVNLIWTLLFPLAMVTNTFAPPETMPSWLGFLAEWNPLSATVTATRELFGNPGVGSTSWVTENAMGLAIMWPILIVAIFLPIAARRYRRLRR
jgi:ABC-type multidrug transport system permease subunit